MIKKEYLKPTMNVVELKYKRRILVDSVSTNGLDGELKYDKNGKSAGDDGFFDTW